MIDYLRRTPEVRDVVVSGGDVANMPWKNLEAFLDAAAGDRQHPRRPARDQGADGPAAALAAAATSSRASAGSRATARSRGVNLAIHTHVNAAQSVTPARRRGDDGDAGRGRPRRPQPGRADARRQRRRERAARPLLRAAGRRDDHAVLLLHVRHDPVQRALAGVAGRTRRSCSTGSWATCPASRRRGSCATCRSSASAGCTRSHAYDTGPRHQRTGRRTTGRRSRSDDPEALTRDYPYYDPIDTLPEEGQAWWRENSRDSSGCTRWPGAGGGQPRRELPPARRLSPRRGVSPRRRPSGRPSPAAPGRPAHRGRRCGGRLLGAVGAHVAAADPGGSTGEFLRVLAHRRAIR